MIRPPILCLDLNWYGRVPSAMIGKDHNPMTAKLMPQTMPDTTSMLSLEHPHEITSAALPFPDIDPIIFSIGFLHLRWYALAYLVGILLGWFLLKRVTAKPDDPIGHPPLDSLINTGIIGIILGGRLAYVAFYNPSYFLSNPHKILAVWEGGLAFHGGFLGMVLAIIFTARRYQVSMFGLGDLIAIAAPIGIFFGRLANFINGELYGRVSDAPWAVIFPGTNGLPRHPSQIYEALLEGLLLFIILIVAWRMGARQHKGLLMGIFITGYGLARIMVENFRQPDQQLGFILGGITMGQILSLPMVVIGAWLIQSAFKKAKP